MYVLHLLTSPLAYLLTVRDCVQGFMTPIILNYFLRFLKDDEWDDWVGYMLAGLLWGHLLIKSFIENRYFFHVNRVALQVRAAVSAYVFAACRRTSDTAL